MTHTLSALSSRSASALARFATETRERRARRAKYRRTLAELEGTSNRDLADLGIARGDIPALAWRTVYGA